MEAVSINMSGPYLSEVVPDEILLGILEFGDFSFLDLAALASTCRRLYHIADWELYEKAARMEQEVQAIPRHASSPINGELLRPWIVTSPIMIWAAYKNRIGAMMKLIKHNADVNVSGWLGGDPSLHRGVGYPIHYAALAGNDEVVEFLLDHGAFINAPSRRRLCDCREGDQLSLHDGPFIRTQPKGFTALHSAICHGQTSTAELLIRRGASYGTIQYLTPPHFDSEPSMRRNEGHPTGAIHTAAAHGQYTLLPLMVQQATQQRGDWASYLQPSGSLDIVNQPHKWGYPLHWAAASKSSNRETIVLLVKMGARINQQFSYPRHREYLHTPLSLATREGQWDSAMTLLDLGARVDRGECYPSQVWKTESLRRATMRSADPWKFKANCLWDSQPRAASVMLQTIVGSSQYDHDIPPNKKPSNHRKAWTKDRAALIKRLVEKERINPSHYFPVEGSYHTTPLIFCITNPDDPEVPKSLVPVLLDLGADVWKKDYDGNTALHYLVGVLPEVPGLIHELPRGNRTNAFSQVFSEAETARACIVSLLDKGASTKVQNEADLSPMDIVIKYAQDANVQISQMRRFPRSVYPYLAHHRMRVRAAQVLQIFLEFPENTGARVDTPLYRLVKKTIKEVVDEVGKEVCKNPEVHVEIRKFHDSAKGGFRDRVKQLRGYMARYYLAPRDVSRDQITWMR